jgi:hypothetical protein
VRVANWAWGDDIAAATDVALVGGLRTRFPREVPADVDLAKLVAVCCNILEVDEFDDAADEVVAALVVAAAGLRETRDIGDDVSTLIGLS